MDMAVTVREATRSDAEAIGGLVGELGYPNSSGVRARLGLWLEVPQRRLLVADQAGDVVGCLALTMTPRLESEKWWAQVVALVVAERARGRGVGRALVERAETLSHGAGCDAVIINSSRRRTGAAAFYARLGYRDRCADHAQFIREPRRREAR